MLLSEVKDEQWFKDALMAVRNGTFSSDWLAKRLVNVDIRKAEEIQAELPYLLLSALYSEISNVLNQHSEALN